jgi:diguanylate cyclase (GGDEF)-like protein
MRLVDIDNFKSFNDGYGHLEGGGLLKKVGSALVAVCRKDDIVYRLGGEEFAVLPRDIQADDVAVQKARGLMDAIAKNAKAANPLRLAASASASLIAIRQAARN